MPNGTFQWGEDVSAYLKSLGKRGEYLLEYPLGYTPEEREAIISQTLSGVKAGERGRIEAKRKGLSRMGLLGTGAEFEEEEKERRFTSEKIAEVRKGFGIEEIMNRFQRLMGTTGMARELGTTMMRAEEIPEVLSGARRAEGFRSIDQFMNYLNMIMGGQRGMLDPYMQAIMGQAGMGGQDMSWLPFLSYYLMDQGGGGRGALPGG
ncbi:hypothetical protein ES703_95618 [subsurface metagenome]